MHLAMGDFLVAKLEELKKTSDAAGDVTEIFVLTEANAREAVEKIFSADGVAVWGEL
jgi:hypothetical protein